MSFLWCCTTKLNIPISGLRNFYWGHSALVTSSRAQTTPCDNVEYITSSANSVSFLLQHIILLTLMQNTDEEWVCEQILFLMLKEYMRFLPRLTGCIPVLEARPLLWTSIELRIHAIRVGGSQTRGPWMTSLDTLLFKFFSFPTGPWTDRSITTDFPHPIHCVVKILPSYKRLWWTVICSHCIPVPDRG